MFQRLRALSRPTKRGVTVAELPVQTSAIPRFGVPETTVSNTNSVTAVVELPAGTPRVYWGSQATEIPLTSSSTFHLQSAARTAPIAEGNDDGILIGVMGVTGCGKSHFCRVATGDDTIRVSNGLDSCMSLGDVDV
jgi:hypothetical protein